MYTSAKTGTNCAPLRQYLLFKTCPELFPSSGAAAELVNQEAIYVPYGYDSMELIQETLLASTTVRSPCQSHDEHKSLNDSYSSQNGIPIYHSKRSCPSQEWTLV